MLTHYVYIQPRFVIGSSKSPFSFLCSGSRSPPSFYYPCMDLGTPSSHPYVKAIFFLP
uniref:Uncharacterized protein n=1 Tax=Physcomitrium patens TaxID=3218 RepID=A0A2K1JDD2_PHYPA|nr:hypothetical protein PHYPA_019822 [Physcomitrium patens]